MPHRIPDTMTKPYAERLVAKIQWYWEKKGYAPAVWLEPLFSGFVVRSEMRGGLPPGCTGEIS